MRVFISWSGDRSAKVANALQQWIPKVIQAARPWMSAASIDPGARWSVEVGQALDEIQFGVLCLTPENIIAPWVLFEAGALSKTVAQGRVVPYLLGFEARELQGPLSQFQAVQADREGTLQLMSAINVAAAERAISVDLFTESFDVWWPKLEPVVKAAATEVPAERPVPARSSEDMLGEVLGLLRSRATTAPLEPEPVPAAPRAYDAIPFEPAVSFGDRLRGLRTTRGLSQADLARLAGVSQPYISMIETGRYYPPPNILRALAAPLGMTPEELKG